MIFEKVRDVIVDVVGCEANEVKLEATLADDLGVDSLYAVEVNMALEEEFSITIPDEALGEMKTVADIVNYVEANK